MARSARLLDLIGALRRRRRPVTAAELAAETGVSARTLYRDIATLQSLGAPIEGEAGFGYVMKPGFFLPPLMFGEDEVDALILGLRLVGQRGDPDLAEAAEEVLAKIVAVLPPALEDAAAISGLLAGPGHAGKSGEAAHVAAMRIAIRTESKMRLAYSDKKGRDTDRIVWPVVVGYFDLGEMLAAWCELRGGFRNFRLDRVRGIEVLDERMPRRHRLLLADWRAAEELE